MPLNRHFWLAGSPADATELTRVQRNPRVLPPPCSCCAVAADGWEKIAETAKANTG